MDKNEYAKRVKQASPSSPLIKDMLLAFSAGGGICMLGELFFQLYYHCGADEKNAAAYVSITLIALTAVFTGIGIFDKLAKHAGAGTMVPITGFANSVVSPAVEFRTEGHIFGTAVKMFSIAGPVIVFGCSAASLYGLIYYCFLR